MKWKCKISSDGRLYNGVWINESVIPDPLPNDEIVFDNFQDDKKGGNDYIWNGKSLVYSPIEDKKLSNSEIE